MRIQLCRYLLIFAMAFVWVGCQKPKLVNSAPQQEIRAGVVDGLGLGGQWVFSKSIDRVGPDPFQDLARTFQNQKFLELTIRGSRGRINLLGPTIPNQDQCVISIPIQLEYSKMQPCGCPLVHFQFVENCVSESRPGCLSELTTRDSAELLSILRPVLGIQRKYLVEANELTLVADQDFSTTEVTCTKSN